MTDEAVSPAMRAEVERELARIEETEGVRVLFAVESGSRAWGFASPDSDYDVRFVYARPVPWYLSIEAGRDVIEVPIDDELDVSGWDVRKAISLMMKPNPVLLEWLSSPIRYRWDGSSCAKLRAMAERVAHGTACRHHYLRLAIRQWERNIEDRERVNLKKYFYVVRPVMALRWLRMRPDELPPMNFHDLVDGTDVSADLADALGELLRAKRQAKEIGEAARVDVIDAFVTEEMARADAALSESARRPAPPSAAADELFRDLIGYR